MFLYLYMINIFCTICYPEKLCVVCRLKQFIAIWYAEYEPRKCEVFVKRPSWSRNKKGADFLNRLRTQGTQSCAVFIHRT